MSLTNFPRHIEDKYCFAQCPPGSCNCRRGNPVEWAQQHQRLGLPAADSVAGQPSSMVHALLNVVLCADKDRAIVQARHYLITEGFLDEAGEPTAKAWEAESGRME